MSEIFEIGNLKIGGGSLFFIGGPCVIENEEITFETAEKIKEICKELEIPFIFKSSYLKDNRSSLESYQGQGLKRELKY